MIQKNRQVTQYTCSVSFSYELQVAKRERKEEKERKELSATLEFPAE